jgi:hypothetical protein
MWHTDERFVSGSGERLIPPFGKATATVEVLSPEAGLRSL